MRATLSATHTGFSAPSASTVKRSTTSHQPPPFSSTATSSALALTRRPERRLAFCALDVDVDPLVVAGDLRERVDVVLRDRPPGRRSALNADCLAKPCDGVCGDCHAQTLSPR